MVSRKRDMNCCWILGVISLINGICLVALSSVLLNQTVFIYRQERLQRESTFAHVYHAPFRNSNWMKSALALNVIAIKGILIGIVQTTASSVSLVMDYSKSIQRKLGWLIWLTAGVIIFTLSSITFGLAVILKAHEYRDPYHSISFWARYREGGTVLIYNYEGHAFCSALAANSVWVLVSMAVVAGNVFRGIRDKPHLLLAI